MFKKSARTKKSLLEAALKLFSTVGYEKTTMRKIADEVEMSLGAAYYYFKGKDELILAFYAETAREAEERNSELLASCDNLVKALSNIIEFKFAQLERHRSLIRVLARYGAQFEHPLSPFSAETTSMRDGAIGIIEEALVVTEVRCNKHIRPHLARVLWLYQLGIILYWANDASEGQVNTRKLMSITLKMIDTVLGLSVLPIFNPVNKAVIRILELVSGGGCAETA